jgi:long-chain acyl-CoA synthetase
VKEPWTADNGCLTPTMKMRRRVIEERYMPLAAKWAERGDAVVFEDE